MGKELIKHYKLMKPSQELTAEASQEYQQLLPQCVQIASDWWESLTVEKKKDWEFRANVADGVFIKNLRGIHGDFVWPPELDHSFKFGWHTNIWIDPREKISKKLFELIDKTKFLRLCFDDDEEWYDDVLEDARDDENYNEGNIFTPVSGYYPTGDGNVVYCFQGTGEDYTACDRECGYCGRCDY